MGIITMLTLSALSNLKHGIISLPDVTSFDMRWLNRPYRLFTGSAVAECLTRDRGAAGSSLTSVAALCP